MLIKRQQARALTKRKKAIKLILLIILVLVIYWSISDQSIVSESPTNKSQQPRVGKIEQSKTPVNNGIATSVKNKTLHEQDNTDLYWSINHLNTVLRLLSEYEAYARAHYQELSLPDKTNQNLKEYQAQLQTLMQLQLAIDETMIEVREKSHLSRFAAESRNNRQEIVLNQRVINLKQASNLLLAIHTQLGMLEFTASQQKLLEISGKHSEELLSSLDKLLRDNSLYSPVVNRPLSNPSLSESSYLNSLFDINGKNQLNGYLASQSQRASYLALNYAEPLLSFIKNMKLQTENDGSIRKWEETLIAINKQQNNEAPNAQRKLETFFTNRLFNTNQSNCSTAVKSYQLSTGKDLFSISLNRIMLLVKNHCDKLKADLQ